MSVLMRCLRALDFLPEILVRIAIRKQIKKNDGTYLTYRWMGTARELLFRDSGTTLPADLFVLSPNEISRNAGVRELRTLAVHVQSEAVARLLAVVKGCTSAHLGGATAGLLAVLALRAVDVAAVLVADLLLLSVHLCHAGSLAVTHRFREFLIPWCCTKHSLKAKIHYLSEYASH